MAATSAFYQASADALQPLPCAPTQVIPKVIGPIPTPQLPYLFLVARVVGVGGGGRGFGSQADADVL